MKTGISCIFSRIPIDINYRNNFEHIYYFILMDKVVIQISKMHCTHSFVCIMYITYIYIIKARIKTSAKRGAQKTHRVKRFEMFLVAPSEETLGREGPWGAC